jgi:hypothetical protein
MSAGNDGGPAFPEIRTQQEDLNHNFEVYSRGGMSLRDWFAGQALAGLLASNANRDNITSAKDEAACAYQMADAMLAARATKATP